MRPVQLLEHRYPLLELVELGATVTEIYDDFGFHVAAIEFVFQLLPALRAPDPVAGALPGR